MSENWVEGSYESGADGDDTRPDDPAEHTEPEDGNDGVLMGLGEASTFEPEEDPPPDPSGAQ